MRDFDTILDPTATVISETAPTLTEQVTIVGASQGASYLAKEPGLWNWTDLRDYLQHEIEHRHGPQVHDSAKEAGVLKAFINRWGITRAVAIAKTSMEVHDGMWHNAPISINRFCKASDPYFAAVIATNI